MKLFYSALLTTLVLVLAPLVVRAQMYPYYGYSYPYAAQYPYMMSPMGTSQNDVVLYPGQRTALYVYGAGQYSTASSNEYVVRHYLIDNVLTLEGMYPGSTTLTLCPPYASYDYGCTNVRVSVMGQYYGNYPYWYGDGYDCDRVCDNDGAILDDDEIRLDEGERKRVDILAMERYVYIADNTNPRVASATIDDDQLVIRGLREGSTRIEVCDRYRCDRIRVIVDE